MGRKVQVWIDEDELDLEQYKGSWIESNVQLLSAPSWDNLRGRWTALANHYGALAIVEVRLTVHTPEHLAVTHGD